MKKILFIPLMFLLVISSANASFCCRDSSTGQYKCWETGQCCFIGTRFEYWTSGECESVECNFKVWVEGPNLFTIGQKTEINLYIENMGSFPDSYTIDYDAESPVVDVELLETDINNILPNEVREINPRILLLESHPEPNTINFTINSKLCPDEKRSTTLYIDSGLPLNLPEFNFVSLLIIISLAGLIFYRRKF
ncbi:MAG: hypothetical protein J7J93_02060 [Candidatus Aenigmarchaeota archaeon]|nr:hypothetical protein [Candidatus Aenigmarchaeota archaeon]